MHNNNVSTSLYKLIPDTADTKDVTAISADDLAKWLKMNSSQKKMVAKTLEQIVKSVTVYAEQYMRRELLIKTFMLIIDCFPVFNDQIELRRSKLTTIDLIEYLNESEVLTTVDATDYYIIESNEYSSVEPLPDKSWPSDLSNRRQAVRITFKAGFGTKSCEIPEEIRTAVLAHGAFLFENRGDCGCGANGAAKFLPSQSQTVYDQNKIINFAI